MTVKRFSTGTIFRNVGRRVEKRVASRGARRVAGISRELFFMFGPPTRRHELGMIKATPPLRQCREAIAVAVQPTSRVVSMLVQTQ
jgi:hypothetical protein